MIRKFASIDWLFFDLGGTLIDESDQEEYIVSEIRAGFLEHGIDYQRERICDELANVSALFCSPVKTAVQTLSQSDGQANDILQRAKYLPELEKLYPRVAETLELLSNRYRLGVIANQSPGAEERMKMHGIHDFFQVFALSGELGISKPDARIFEFALRQSGCLPSQAVYIGDRIDNDIRPAKRLGFSTVRMLQGLGKYQTPNCSEDIPDIEIEKIDQLPKALNYS